MTSVLIVAAHPDDEVLGCGGTIAKLAREGASVHVAILGEGMTSRYAKREQADASRVENLQDCARRAADLLGATEVHCFGLPDNRFDTVPLLDIVKRLEELIQVLRPEVVYTQHGGDLNIDHAATFRATLTATRPLPQSPVRVLYSYEVGSSTDWGFQQFSPPFHPNRFVDISDSLDLKLRAIELYHTEARSFPHPRSTEALRANAVRWGSVAGFGAAEAFMLIRDCS